MTDAGLEVLVGNLLRAGVSLAAAIVLAGGFWYLAAYGAGHADYHHFQHGAEAMPYTKGLSTPLQTIQIGLLLLVATPVARVILSLVAFGIERDKVYVGITLVVLAILTYSLTGG